MNNHSVVLVITNVELTACSLENKNKNMYSNVNLKCWVFNLKKPVTDSFSTGH